MGSDRDQLLKPASQTEKVERAIRRELESGSAGLSDVIQSERELARRFEVGRITVRRALKRLVADGYLISRPRAGYAVARGANESKSNLVAYVHGSAKSPWEWTDFQLQLWNSIQQAAADADRSLLAIGMEGRTPEELGRHLQHLGVGGCVLDADDPRVSKGVGATGIPLVQIDAAHSGFASVTQDNFGGAFSATSHLISKGYERIAWLGCDFSPNPNVLHFNERLGGYLAAMERADLRTPRPWRLIGRPLKPAVEKLFALASRKGGPEAAVVLWPELLPELAERLGKTQSKLDVVVWWGCQSAQRARWRERHPEVKVPDGMVWQVEDLGATAIRQLSEIGRGGTARHRTLVPVDLLLGEEP